MDDLQKIREKINAVDAQLQKLLNERWQYIAQVKHIKQLQPGQSPNRPYREASILQNFAPYSHIPTNDLRAIWKEIMSVSAQRQNPFTIICQESFFGHFAQEIFYEFGRHGQVIAHHQNDEVLCQQLQGQSAGMAVCARSLSFHILKKYPRVNILSLFPSVLTPLCPKPVGFILGWQEKEQDNGQNSLSLYQLQGEIYIEDYDEIPSGSQFLCFVPKPIING